MSHTHPLKSILNPQSVAVIGASEDQSKFGGRLYKMLLKHRYRGQVYPINPSRDSLFGLPTYPSIDATPEAPDMVIMALPRDKVKSEITACAARGAKAGIILTSKFSDAGPEGLALEREVVAAANAHGMRLIGPNCLGLISPANHLVLCSSPALDVDRLIEAPIGFISQSGALMGTLFDRSHGMGIGFSHCVSVGNQADLELADFIEFLIEDERTDVICSYVEGIKSPQRVIELARRARAAAKPWLMVKAGSTEVGSRAAYSHTASMAGDFQALKSICEQENIVLMNDPLDMLGLARAMSKYPRRQVRQVAVLTTSGGGGAISADRLCEAGVGLTPFTPETALALSEHYSPGQAANPIDIGGRKHEGNAPIGKVSAEIAMADPGTDLALVVMTTAPDVPGLTREFVEGMEGPLAQGKPALFVMLPGRVGEPARRTLIEAGIPYVDTLAEGVNIVRAWKSWSEHQAAATPVRPGTDYRPIPPAVGALGESAAKALLASAGIAVNQERVIADVQSATEAAAQMRFPLALKVISPDIVHKSDVGGVALNIADAADLQARLSKMQEDLRRGAPDAHIEGFSLQTMETGDLELIVGARLDPQFGPQVIVGAGGVLVELFKDFTVLPAPTDPRSVRAALQRLKIAPLLGSYRGREALDTDAVVDTVVRLSWLAADLCQGPGISTMEIEVNPLKVRQRGQGVTAVDARALIR